MTERLNIHEYSVSELSGAIKSTLEDAYGHVRVRGEIGRVSRPGSGHIYLDLKDEKAVLSSVVWKGQVPRLKIKPEQGLEVVCTGRLTTFAGQSRYQIVIESMEPAGVGALMALLEERRKMLAAEGLFDTAHKKPLPYLPAVIGVVTSPTGAVIRDILHRLSDRFPRHVLVWPALVQGDKAAGQIAAGIEGFNALPADGEIPRPDVLIVARGGGSIEDLWPFNEEIVVRAAFASQIPLISAVGHETDTTLIDFAADRRAPTPTAAAEIAVPVRAELMAKISDVRGALIRAEARLLERGRSDLAGLARHLPKGEDLFAWPQQKLDMAVQQLESRLRLYIETQRGAYQRRARLSPRALMTAIARKEERLANLAGKLRAAEARHLERARDRYESGSRSLMRRPLRASVVQAGERLQTAEARLDSFFARGIQERRAHLRGQAQLLKSLSYHGVLERGYAVVLTAEGSLVRRADATRAGDQVVLRFADGDAGAQITGATVPAKTSANPLAHPSANPPSKKSPGGPAPKQGSLF